MEMIEKEPKVSVCVVTYNQEKYIRQCLQSIVDQETNFTFEVIVGDDCSTDGTQIIVKEFAERYPDVVKPMYQEKNIGGGYHNYLSVHRAARGKYVAHLDGDDAMLPCKLQYQADAMDGDDKCSASFHLMEIIDKESIRSGKLWLSESYSSKMCLEDLILKHPNVGHSSLMYRRLLLKDFLVNRNSDFIDLHIYIALAGVGYLIPVNKILGLYRIGVGSSANEKVLDLVFDVINSVKTESLSKKIINTAALRFSKNFAVLMLLNKNQKLFLKYWKLKNSYERNLNFAGSAIEKIANNKFLFFMMEKQYRLIAKVRDICN